MTYYFLYKTTCIPTGRYYLGMHSTENLHDSYLGSGFLLKRSIAKHGKSQHRRDILEFFETWADLSSAEHNLVNLEILEDPLCMNLVLGGYGGLGPATRRLSLLRSNPELKAKQLKHLAEARDRAAKTRKLLYQTNAEFRQRHLEISQEGNAASVAVFAANKEMQRSRHEACLKGRRKWQLENPEAGDILRLNGRKSWSVRQALYDRDPEAKAQMLQRMVDNRCNAHTEDANRLRSQSLKQRYATQEHNHKGRVWVCHPDGRSTLVPNPDPYLKEGWVLGRKIKVILTRESLMGSED